MRLAKDEEEALNMLFEVCMCEYTHALLQLDSKKVCTPLSALSCSGISVLPWMYVPNYVSSAPG